MATTEAKAAAAAKKKAAQEAAAAAKKAAKEELAAKVKTVNLAQSDEKIAKDLGITEADLGGYSLTQKLMQVTGLGEKNYYIGKLQSALRQGAKLGPEYFVQGTDDGGSYYTQDFVLPDGRELSLGDVGVNRVVPYHNGSYQLAMTAYGGGDLLFDVKPDKTTGSLAINPKSVQVDTGASNGGLGGLIDNYGIPLAFAAMGLADAGYLGELGAAEGAATGATAVAPTIDTIAADYYGVPVGSEYVAPTVTDLGTVAGSTEGIASGTSAADLAAAGSSGGGIAATPGAGLELASTTGAPTLTAGGTSLAEMGGAQGLTIPGAAGGTLGAAGLNAATGATAAGIGSGLGTSEAALGTGSGLTGTSAAGAGAGASAAAASGSTLADVLPYTAGANVVAALITADAAKKGAEGQVDAANKATALQQKNFETINQQQAPYRATGYNALNNIAGLTTGATPQYDASGNIVRDANGNPVMISGSGYLQHQFNANDLKAGLAPNYDFMLQQGQMANQRAANMGGGALGGNALQGLNKYTQDYAGNAYQNAFTNYQNQRNNIYNTLAGIAGIGQTGQNATNTASTNYTNAASQLGVGSAAAQAAGTTGAANAYGNAVNNVTNSYTLASLLNQGGRIA